MLYGFFVEQLAEASLPPSHISLHWCLIFFGFSYLPYDRTGDWLYQVTEALSFCLAGSVVYLCRLRHKNTYDPSSDTLNHLLLILPAAVLAILFHPSLNAFMPADVRSFHCSMSPLSRVHSYIRAKNHRTGLTSFRTVPGRLDVRIVPRGIQLSASTVYVPERGK